MIHSKLTHLLAALALALVAGGCAMEAAPEDPSTPPDDTTAELRVEPAVQAPVNAIATGGGAAAPIEALVQVPVVLDLRKLGEPADVDGDGPRPHPWTPSPESNSGSGGTNTGGNTNTTPSSPSK